LAITIVELRGPATLFPLLVFARRRPLPRRVPRRCPCIRPVPSSRVLSPRRPVPAPRRRPGRATSRPAPHGPAASLPPGARPRTAALPNCRPRTRSARRTRQQSRLVDLLRPTVRGQSV